MEVETNSRGWVCCTERVEKRAPMGRRHVRVRVGPWLYRINFSPLVVVDISLMAMPARKCRQWVVFDNIVQVVNDSDNHRWSVCAVTYWWLQATFLTNGA